MAGVLSLHKGFLGYANTPAPAATFFVVPVAIKTNGIRFYYNANIRVYQDVFGIFLKYFKRRQLLASPKPLAQLASCPVRNPFSCLVEQINKKIKVSGKANPQ